MSCHDHWKKRPLRQAGAKVKSDFSEAMWTTAYVNDLPDSSFAYIEPGEKDEDGKTPKERRHLPYKDANGKVDAAHLRNALARLNQTQISTAAKAAALRKLRAASKSVGNDEDTEEALRDVTRGIFTDLLHDQPEALALLEAIFHAPTIDRDVSYEAIIKALQEACACQDERRVVATFPDRVVFDHDGKLYSQAYSIDGAEVDLDGEPAEVHELVATNGEDMKLQESQALIEARPSGSIKHGKLNRALNIIEGATMIGPMSSNGTNKKRRYSEKALKQIAEQAEGLPGYINHTKPEDAFKPRDVRDIAVRHRNVRFDPTTQSVRSDMYVMPNHADLVFALAENFGDHIGNSLVSKGSVVMEGDTEVVQDILAVRSADIVSDPASTKGLFEGTSGSDTPLTITDLIESLKTTKGKEDPMDLAAILAHLKEHVEDQKLLAEHYGWLAKTDAAKLQESSAALTAKVAEQDKAQAALTAKVAEQDKALSEAKVELDGYKAKEAVAAKRAKLQETIAAHPIKKEFGSTKEAISENFVALLESQDEASWKKILDDRHASLKSVPRGNSPRSEVKEMSESQNGGLPAGAHERVAALLARN